VRILRYLLCWHFWFLFVVTACVLVIVEPRVLLKSMARTGASSQFKIQIATAVAMIVATLVFAKAWRVLRNEQLHARVCVPISNCISITTRSRMSRWR